MIETSTDLPPIALHEAGHAAAALLLKVPVVSVSVIVDTTSNGRVLTRQPVGITRWLANGQPRPVPARVKRRLLDDLMVSMAGPLVVADGYDEDILDIIKTLDLLTDDPVEAKAAEDRAWAETRTLLEGEEFAELVIAISNALLAERHLSGRRVRAIARDVHLGLAA